MSDRPSTPTPSEAEVVRALARSGVYRVLACAFRPPGTGAGLDTLAAAVAAVADGLPESVRGALTELAAASQAVDAAQRLRDHAAVFGHVVVPDCPLYETAAEAGDPFRQPQTLADLVGFYRAWGLEVGPEAHERADHLALELEFMHYLTYREAHALRHHGADRSALVREAEQKFLAEHLARWAPAVGHAVAARARGWLGAAGRLLERFVTWEADTHGVAVGAGVALGPDPIPEDASDVEDEL